MRQQTRNPSKWSSPEVVAERVKSAGYTTKRAWREGSAGSYQTCRNNGWTDIVVATCGLNSDHKCKYQTIADVVDIVMRNGYRSIVEWREKSSGSHDAAIRYGWRDEVMRLVGIERQHTIWESVEQVIALVREHGFSTKVEWIKGHSKSYSRARQLGWLEQVYAECKLQDTFRHWETIDAMADHVRTLNCSSKNELADMDSGCYGSALNRGWLDDICDMCGIPKHNSDEQKTAMRGRKHRVYILIVHTKSGAMVGYGNSSRLRHRLRQHRANARKAGAKITLFTSYEFNDFHAAHAVEESLLNTFPQRDTGVTGFMKEATDIGNLEALRDFVAKKAAEQDKNNTTVQSTQGATNEHSAQQP